MLIEISLVRNFMDLTTALAFVYLALVLGLKRRQLEEVILKKNKGYISISPHQISYNDPHKLSEYDLAVPPTERDDEEIQSSFKSKRNIPHQLIKQSTEGS